jgi:hypothetical protein
VCGSKFNVRGAKLGIGLVQFIKDPNTLNIEPLVRPPSSSPASRGRKEVGA